MGFGAPGGRGPNRRWGGLSDARSLRRSGSTFIHKEMYLCGSLHNHSRPASGYAKSVKDAAGLADA